MAKFKSTFKLRTTFDNKRTGTFGFLYHYVVEEPSQELIDLANSKATPSLYQRDGEIIATTFNPIGLEAVVTVSKKGAVNIINEELMAELEAAQMLMPALRKSALKRIEEMNHDLVKQTLDRAKEQYEEYLEEKASESEKAPAAKKRTASKKKAIQPAEDFDAAF